MNQIFAQYLDEFLVELINNILIYPKNQEEHVKQLKIVL